MHCPPTVEVPVGRVPALGWAICTFWAAGALAACAYSYQMHSGNVLATASVAALALATVGAGLASAWYWRTQPVGTLAFSGSEWRWLQASGSRAVGAPSVHLDVQRLMLLRLPLARGGIWLWLAPGADDMRWRALRRAVYSRPTAMATNADAAVTP